MKHGHMRNTPKDIDRKVKSPKSVTRDTPKDSLCCTVNPYYICTHCRWILCAHCGENLYYDKLVERGEISTPTKAAYRAAGIRHSWRGWNKEDGHRKTRSSKEG